MENKKRRRGSPLGAVLLILIGGILLLNVLGLLEWSIWWTILRLWPVLLIAAGLELLLGRWRWGSLVSTILVVGVVVAALWLTSTGVTISGLDTAEIRQPLGDATRAELSIDPGVGTLRVEAASESANLVEGTVRLGKGEEIKESFSQQGDTATYKLSTQGASWTAFSGGWDQSRIWELGLSPGASLAVNTDMGVGDHDLDLTGLVVEQLEVGAGMGRIKVTLPATGQFAANLSQGIGVVEIVVPKGMAVRIEADTALAVRELPDDLVKQEELYSSPGYATAENRVEIDAGVAIGLLTVRYQE
jgi:IS5 family transposase